MSRKWADETVAWTDSEAAMCCQANHVLLDSIDGEWSLVLIGNEHSGKRLRRFSNKGNGIAFVKANKITNCRMRVVETI